MGEISKNQRTYNLLCVIVMFLLLLFAVWPAYKQTDSSRISCNIFELDRGWTVEVNDQRYEDVTLSEFTFDMCNRGDKVNYYIQLPTGMMIDSPILEFYSIHSVIDVYLDEKLVFTYGHEIYESGQLIGYGKNFIPLPDDYAGKELRISLLVAEDNAFDGQQTMALVDGNYIFRKELAERRITLLISTFLIMFGIIVMALSIVMRVTNVSFTQTFCIAMFSFLVGAWTICNSDIIAYFITDPRVKLNIEYTTFFALPLPFTFYFKGRVDDKRTPIWLKIYFWIMAGCEVAFFLTTYICQRLNISHYPKYVSTCHIIMVVLLIFIILSNWVERIKNKNKKDHTKTHFNAITIGFGIAVIAVAWELMRFNLSKYFIGFRDNKYNSSLGIAILIVVISLLVDFAQDVSKNVYKSAEQRLLEQMAYVDELTGLSNRRRCEETLLDLKQRAIPYAVLSLDMNFLKKVNDSLGHEKGDALLKRFSDMLMEVYGLHGIVGRMGGDEFIVILPEVTKAEAENLIGYMKATMLKKNVDTTQLKLSTAYGLAMSDEVGKDQDAHAAYRLADERMYENKRQSKLGRA